MERPKNIETPVYKRRMPIAALLIMVFHVVGLIGFSVPVLKPYFIQIVPFHLLLMLVLLAIEHKPFDGKFILFFVLIFVAGYAVEWIGINKGWLFGSYHYGTTLGIMAGGVPIIIGVNWFLLVYGTATALALLELDNIWWRVLGGAIIMVTLDIMIEAVAGKFDYWHWAGKEVPVKNYGSWFFISVAMLFAFEKFGFKKQSIAGAVLIACQFIFFAALQQ